LEIFSFWKIGNILVEDFNIFFSQFFFIFIFFGSFIFDIIFVSKAAKIVCRVLCHEHHEGRKEGKIFVVARGIQSSHCLIMNQIITPSSIALIGW